VSELARVIEALLFLSSDPVATEELAEATGAHQRDVTAALAELETALSPGERGIQLRRLAGGYTLSSDPLAEDAARALLAKPRLATLTPAALETLAIVAYLSPVSRPEIARIRGVNADSPVASLLDRGLIEESGRSPFGAVTYRTTTLFLKLFGLQELGELPDLAQWDPTPQEEAGLRERLLAAGDARSGVVPKG
jgi:segregation and condensation protein B